MQDPDKRVDKEEVIEAVKNGVELLEGHVRELEGFLDKFGEAKHPELAEEKLEYSAQLTTQKDVLKEWQGSGNSSTELDPREVVKFAVNADGQVGQLVADRDEK